MHIIVLGAGVIGVTTAYELVKQGHNVTVIEKHSKAAMECSFQNGGQLSYSHAKPWANPAILKYLPRWLCSKNSPLSIRTFDTDLLTWLCQFLWACRASKVKQTSHDIFKLAEESKAAMHELLTNESLDFDMHHDGTMMCYRTLSSLENGLTQANLQATWGGSHRYLDSLESCITVEPALAHTKQPYCGGIYFPGDAAGNVQKFTSQLAAILEKKGVTFHYNTSITSLLFEKKHIKAIRTNKGEFSADTIIVCLGAMSGQLVKPLGINLPIYPLKGYSIDIPIQPGEHAPTCSLTDEAHKIVISRLGNTVRIAGTAEFSGFNAMLYPQRIDMLKHFAKELFPQLSAIDQATVWTCHRPATPGNLPIIGKTTYDNLLLNTGHGTLGWTLACGSAKRISNLVQWN